MNGTLTAAEREKVKEAATKARKKRNLALKRMINHYPDILSFTRDAVDLYLVLSHSEARRLYTVLKEK